MPEETKIKLRNVRLSYPSLFTAKVFTNPDGTAQEPKFQAVFLLDKGEHKKVIDLVESRTDEVLKEAFKKVPAKCRRPLRDGEEKEDKDGYGPGVMFISAASKRRPQVVDRDPSIPLVEADGRPYAGCYVNAIISLWSYDHKLGGKGVSANLLAVQFLKDGEPFGETIKADEAFDDESDGGEEDGLA
jgi:hypothetical protein